MRQSVLCIAALLLTMLGCDARPKPEGATTAAAVASSAPLAATSATTSTPRKPAPHASAPKPEGPIPGPPLRADNADEVRRYPNEKPVDTIANHIQQDMNVRKAPNKEDGDLVAPLRAGTPVTKLARRGQWFLITFADPKDKSKTLAGWTWEQAFFHPAGPGDEKRLCECWTKLHDAEGACEDVRGKSKAECDRSFGGDCEKLVKCVHGELSPTCLDGERLLLPHGVCAKTCKSNAACPNDQVCTDKMGAPSVCLPAEVKEP